MSGGLAARYRLHMEVTQAPGRTDQHTAGKLVLQVWGQSRGQSEQSWTQGVAQTPQVQCGEEGRDPEQAYPSGVRWGEGSLGMG